MMYGKWWYSPSHSYSWQLIEVYDHLHTWAASLTVLNILHSLTTVLCHFPPLFNYTCSAGSAVYVNTINEPTASGNKLYSDKILMFCFHIPSTQLLLIGSWYIIKKHKLLYNQAFHSFQFARDSPGFMSFKDLSRCLAKYRSGSQILQVFPSHENATLLTIFTDILTLQ